MIMVAVTIGALVSIVLYSSVLSTSGIKGFFNSGNSSAHDEDVDLMEHRPLGSNFTEATEVSNVRFRSMFGFHSKQDSL